MNWVNTIEMTFDQAEKLAFFLDKQLALIPILHKPNAKNDKPIIVGLFMLRFDPQQLSGYCNINLLPDKKQLVPGCCGQVR